MSARTKHFLFATAALALALPALAQESILPPGFGNEAAPLPPAVSPPVAPSSPTTPATSVPSGGDELAVTGALPDELFPTARPPIEIPDSSRRDPTFVGAIDPARVGLSEAQWGNASGAFLGTLMRRMDTPLASRWAHIALRNALISKTKAPRNINPVDWAAERAWLLLRLGEADAARMIVADVDVDNFTPKMFQIAVQSALSSGDPVALCPLQDGITKVESRISPLVRAMCSALTGNPETAAADIEAARRRGTVGGIDLLLADKVVGAGADTARAVTIEWEPVDKLTSWRFGLATATGMMPPERLMNSSSLRLRAWQASMPQFAPEDRLQSARIATGLGVFSSTALMDLYSSIYDATDADELPQSDAWQLRTAFVGRDQETRLAAMRRLWAIGRGPLDREASRALAARAATRILPDAKLQSDAPNLIASMLAAGYDREAAQWAGAIRRMDDEPADACWAMLALAAPSAGIDTSYSRINAFVGRDDSKGHRRSALLVAGLAALGRIDARTAARLDSRYDLGLDRPTRWTRMIDGAAKLGQAGTVNLLVATGMQTNELGDVPASHLAHAVAAMRLTGQEYMARMVAAEALART
ncbi:MAG TPA: hypothetical protein VK485_01075 [Sphingomicrobium sp.]|nr:hypothetical protein [Sphingomicrobium sp.]